MSLQWKDNEESGKCIDHKRSFLYKLCLYFDCNSIIMMTCHMQLLSACIFFASNYSCWSDNDLSMHVLLSVHFPSGHQWLLVGLEWNTGNLGMKLYFDIFMLFNTYHVPTSRVHFHKCTSTHFQGCTSTYFQGCTSTHFQGCTSTHFQGCTSVHLQQRTFTHSQQCTSDNALFCTPTSFKYLHPHFYALAHSYALSSAHFHALEWTHFYALPTAHFYALQPHLHICTRTFTFFYALLCTPN